MSKIVVVRIGDECGYYHNVSGKAPINSVDDAVARAANLQSRYPWIKYLIYESGKPPFVMENVHKGYRNAKRFR